MTLVRLVPPQRASILLRPYNHLRHFGQSYILLIRQLYSLNKRPDRSRLPGRSISTIS